MSKLYAELMRSIEVVRTKQQNIQKEIKILRDMTYEDNIYVEFYDYGIEVRAREYLVDALVKELESKLAELYKIEMTLLYTLKSTEEINL